VGIESEVHGGISLQEERPRQYNPPLILVIKLIKLKPEEEKHYQLASTCTLLLQLDEIKKYTLTRTQKKKKKEACSMRVIIFNLFGK